MLNIHSQLHPQSHSGIKCMYPVLCNWCIKKCKKFKQHRIQDIKAWDVIGGVIEGVCVALLIYQR